MIKLLKQFFRIAFYYVILFAFWRKIFFLFNQRNQGDFHFGEIIAGFFHGLRMDLSVISYLLVLPLVLLLIPGKQEWKGKLSGYYHLILAFLITLICMGNILLFHFWGGLINYRALTYLSDPQEIFTSLSFFQSFLVVMSIASVMLFQVFLIRKFLPIRTTEELIIQPLHRLILLVLMSGVLILGIRGGWQMLPMNESLVYYSKKPFLNQVAINPVWHLAYDVRAAGLTDENPFLTMPEAEAEKIVHQLYASNKDSFPEILSNRLPNIVVLILESHTADVVASLGGESGISPVLEQLMSEGVSFSNIYSSGARTDQGIVSVMNGWPATPYHSIMRSAEKSARLPSLPKIFNEKGYATSFYYGGESNFSNLNVYCINQGFHVILEQEDFDKSTPSGKWGIDDEHVLAKQLGDLAHVKEPFFSVTMTLSNHEPFEVPGPARFPGDDEANKFRNSAAYADACIGDFFRKAKTQTWYKNTLFVLVADHGHLLPKHRNDLYPNSRHIPMFLYGDVIKPEFRGIQITKLGGHHDLPGTLLPQLGIDASAFAWSKNLLTPGAKNFAYFQMEHVLGWMEEKDWIAYSYNRKNYVLKNDKTSHERNTELLHKGQAFIQEIYKAYNGY
ncbi:MAG: sulfatase-like hydrolase/transferase [Bacteroidetes bacterium]|nr:sulfatase-like hydrolase/transferase [Bacteroidota bacterium]